MKKILVVDDEQDVCTYLGRLFAEHGYTVACAGDGSEAFQKVEQEKPDLITLDLSMPRESGVRFYRDLKARPEFGRIPVVLVTAVTGPGGPKDTERFYGSRRGVPPPDGFVAKPIEQEEILGVVRRLIG